VVTKSEMRAAVAAELEKGYVAAKRAAEDDAEQWEGAKKSLNGAVKAIEGLLGHVARDVKEEILDQPTAKSVQLYLRRASALCDNMRLKAEVNKQRALGRAEGMSLGSSMAERIGRIAAGKAADALAPADENPRLPRNRLAALKAQKLEASEPDDTSPEAPPEKATKKTPKKATKKK